MKGNWKWSLLFDAWISFLLGNVNENVDLAYNFTSPKLCKFYLRYDGFYRIISVQIFYGMFIKLCLSEKHNQTIQVTVVFKWSSHKF